MFLLIKTGDKITIGYASERAKYTKECYLDKGHTVCNSLRAFKKTENAIMGLSDKVTMLCAHCATTDMFGSKKSTDGVWVCAGCFRKELAVVRKANRANLRMQINKTLMADGWKTTTADDKYIRSADMIICWFDYNVSGKYYWLHVQCKQKRRMKVPLSDLNIDAKKLLKKVAEVI